MDDNSAARVSLSAGKERVKQEEETSELLVDIRTRLMNLEDSVDYLLMGGSSDPSGEAEGVRWDTE